MQTSWFKRILKNKALEIANQQINGTVSIDELSGNFFSNLHLTNIAVLLENGDTLLSLNEFGLDYSLSALLKKELRVNFILLDKPVINLKVMDDGSFNFESLMPESEADTITTESEPFSLPFDISLGAFNLNNGLITLRDTAEITPERVENINIALDARYASDNSLSASLKEFTFLMQSPDLHLKNLTLNVDFDNERYRLTDFKLITALNNIEANAGYKDMENFDAGVEWANIKTEEFSFALPGIIIPANPDFKFDVSNDDNKLNIDFGLAYKDESLSLKGKIDNLGALLSDTTRHLSLLDLALNLNNIRPNTWLEMKPMPLIANANVMVKGNGLSYKVEPLRIEGSLMNTQWDNILLNRGDIIAAYSDGAVTADMDIEGIFGILKAYANLDINSPDTPFQVHLETDRLAIHELLPTVVDSTLISMSLDANGKGFSPDSMNVGFSGLLYSSVAEHVDIDTLQFNGFYNMGDIKIDALKLLNQSVNINLAGFYDKKGNLGGDVEGKILNTNAFSHYLTSPMNWDKAMFIAKASGNIDSINFDLSSTIAGFDMDTTLSLNLADIAGKGKIVNNKIFAEASINLAGLEASSIKIDSTVINGAMNDTLFNVSLLAGFPDEMDLALKASGSMGKKIEVLLQQLDFDAPAIQLQLKDAPAIITYGDSIVTLQNLNIVNRNDSAFNISADAYVSILDDIKLNASIKDVELALLSQFGLMDDPIEGRATLNINADANSGGVFLTGDAHITDLKFDPIDIKDITANIDFRGDTVLMDAAVHNSVGDSIILNLKTPLTAKLQDSITVSWSETFEARLLADKIHLENLFLATSDLIPEGILDMDFSIDGSVSEPIVKGYADLSQGAISLPQYGVNYNDMRLKVSIDNTDVKLDSLFIRHLKGTLLAQGGMEIDSVITSGKIKNSDISILAKDFYLSNHRNHEMQIYADAFFKNEIDSIPTFGGNITVLRASFNLPAIMNMASGSSSLGEPMLIQAIRESDIAKHDTIRIIVADTLPTQSVPPFMQQLTGTLKLEMPRNFWVKSDDMQIELYGNLDAVKTSDIFELFGTLGIQRGYYTLYGKKIIIDEGEITFTGGYDFNPNLNLKASYIFRNPDREKREMKFAVGGDLSEPVIEFSLDGQPIPEADAVSYIMFGQSFDELSYGSQEGVSNNLPSRMISSMLSSQLSKTLGNTLKLDMVEIDAGDNWQNTTFMVGKYLTNNLFVTYQRSFGQADSDDISPEIITLEYEITRRISLRLMKGDVKDTGIDLIVKFEK